MHYTNTLPLTERQTKTQTLKDRQTPIHRHTYLCEFVERRVGRVVRDEEPHGLMVNFNSGRAVHVGKTTLKQ